MAEKYIVRKIGKPACYEQLAEECLELAKEALKMARIMRKENPTPRTLEETRDKVIEEYADVVNCITTLDIPLDEKVMERKMKRWIKRIKEKEEEDK